jgi:selenocysteine lyase/cysteine desulfurase
MMTSEGVVVSVERFRNRDGRIWLNTAHRGVLPANAVDDAITWKRNPSALTSERFTEVTERTRGAVADLLRVPRQELALSNSASEGLHLLANGLDLRKNDEVLVANGDFPSTVLPWLGLREEGG